MHVFKVLLGAGTGLLFSSEIIDSVFYNLVERNFLLIPSSRKQQKIKHYFRFRDDLFFIMDNTLGEHHIFERELASRSGLFRILRESMSFDEAIFLDVCIFQGPRWTECTCLDYNIHIKNTSIWTPLPPDSNHPVQVQHAWPKAQRERYKNRCYSKASKIRASNNLENEFDKVGILNIMKPVRTRDPSTMQTSIVWLILPYKQVWALAAGLRSSHVYKNMLQVRFGWKLGDNHVYQRIKLAR